MARSRYLPEIAVACAIFVLGAWFYQAQLAPEPAPAPEISAPAIAPKPPPPPQWKTATAAQRKVIAAPIRAQLEAFAKNDWKTAIQFQSAGLQQNFASPKDFQAMMQTSYPQFATCQKVEFFQIQISPDGKIAQAQARVTGSDHTKASAIYQMVRESDGFRVAGVAGGQMKPATRI